MATNVKSLIETKVTNKIKISSEMAGLKTFATSKKLVKLGDRGDGGKMNKYVRLESRKALLAIIAIVESGSVYEITNLLSTLALTRAQFLVDRRLPLLSD